MFSTQKSDLQVVLDRDPAAKSAFEVIFCYPGYRAVRMYRRAHFFQTHGMRLLARMISEWCRFRTGVDIHPAAQIGRRLFIDHGTGVVIGESAVIGDDVTIYQGATLGGTGKDVGKRHPTIGDNVLIGTGAKILGPITVGSNSRIAANSVVLSPIPEDSTAVGIPARVVRIAGQKVDYVGEVDQIHVADPVSIELAALRRELSEHIGGEQQEKKAI